jgi:HEAT repeat protein
VPVRPPTADEVRLAPAGRVELLVSLLSADEVADWCVSLLRGADPEAAGGIPLAWLGGRSAPGWTQAYWPKVWAVRGLLHAYRPQAAAAVVAGLDDESWRVREMCAKVARAHEVGSAAEALHRLCADEVPRVRAAAVRALAVVGEAEDADVLRDCLDDPERSVVAAAERALRDLSRRLDRSV